MELRESDHEDGLGDLQQPMIHHVPRTRGKLFSDADHPCLDPDRQPATYRTGDLNVLLFSFVVFHESRAALSIPGTSVVGLFVLFDPAETLARLEDLEDSAGRPIRKMLSFTQLLLWSACTSAAVPRVFLDKQLECCGPAVEFSASRCYKVPLQDRGFSPTAGVRNRRGLKRRRTERPDCYRPAYLKHDTRKRGAF